MRTRLVVAAAITVCFIALAGCSQPAGSLSVEPVNDTELADRASTQFPVEELVDSERSGRGARVLRGAVRNGSTTIAATEPPVPDRGSVYQTDGRFYTVSFTAVGTTTGRQVTYRLDGNATAEEADRNGWAVVDYGSLPPIDRAALDYGSEAVISDEDRSVAERTRTYNPSELNRSAIATGRYDAVRRDGVLVELDIEANEPRDMTVYRYRTTSVASDASEYARCLEREYAFELSGLDPEPREVVMDATGGTYRVENTSNTAFRSVIERFQSHPAVSADPTSGSWLTRHQGRLYWVDLQYPGFEEYHEKQPEVTPPAAVCF
jgi:hypothetical protein